MRCPNCRRETPYEGNPYRPFCSERCKLLDLDNWLEGRYRIPEPSESQEDAGPEDTKEDADEDGG